MNESKIMVGDVDVTEKVQILYDMAHSSMDWGSGMLDNEEMEAVIDFAVFMGWQVPDISSQSPPIQQIALKYPDHYDVEEIHHPEVNSGNYTRRAFTQLVITVKKKED